MLSKVSSLLGRSWSCYSTLHVFFTSPRAVLKHETRTQSFRLSSTPPASLWDTWSASVDKLLLSFHSQVPSPNHMFPVLEQLRRTKVGGVHWNEVPTVLSRILVWAHDRSPREFCLHELRKRFCLVSSVRAHRSLRDMRNSF